MIIATLYIPIFFYFFSIDDSSSGHEKSGASVGRAPHYTRQPAADPPGKNRKISLLLYMIQKVKTV